MARKILVALLAIVALALVGYWLVLALASHETRIRWLLESMEEGFNESSIGTMSEGLADDFTEIDSGADRQTTVIALLAVFRGNRSSGGEFLYRCHIVSGTEPEAIEVAEAEPPTARVTVTADFFHRAASGDPPAEKKTATIRFDGELVLAGGDWKIRRARHRLLSGKSPF